VPRIRLTSPLSGVLAQSDITLSFAVEGGSATDTQLCGLDSGPRVPCTSPHVFSSVPEGLHTITVSANAASGQSTFDRVSVLVNLGSFTPIAVQQVAAGRHHTCALLVNGKVRCWGDNSLGQLGYGTYADLSDMIPAALGDVDVGGEVVQIAAGGDHTCALLRTGGVRCWGFGLVGQLGYAFMDRYIGGREVPAAAGDVNVGGRVIQITAGDQHTCALLEGDTVRCWGNASSGQLGYGNTNVGWGRTPAENGDVAVGGAVAQVEAGDYHTCALLRNGRVRCWGANALGYGNPAYIGDDELPSSAGDVSVGGLVQRIATGVNSTCALLTSGALRCWGYVPSAQDPWALIGDDELPSSVPPVNVGGAVGSIDAGGGAIGTLSLMCAQLTTGGVRCWGYSEGGALGYERAGLDIVGADDVAARGDIRVGQPVRQVTAGGDHTCALVDGGAVRCWGGNTAGELGYGHKLPIGDDEPPSAAGDVPIAFE
jgi:alpha-tubulin suppressor-like RCC1 family protein